MSMNEAHPQGDANPQMRQSGQEPWAATQQSQVAQYDGPVQVPQSVQPPASSAPSEPFGNQRNPRNDAVSGNQVMAQGAGLHEGAPQVAPEDLHNTAGNLHIAGETPHNAPETMQVSSETIQVGGTPYPASAWGHLHPMYQRQGYPQSSPYSQGRGQSIPGEGRTETLHPRAPSPTGRLVNPGYAQSPAWPSSQPSAQPVSQSVPSAYAAVAPETPVMQPLAASAAVPQQPMPQYASPAPQPAAPPQGAQYQQAPQAAQYPQTAAPFAQYPAQPAQYQQQYPQHQQYQPQSQPQPQPQFQQYPQSRPQPVWPTYYAQSVPMAVPTFAPIDPRAWWRTWRRKVVNRAMGLTFAYEGVMWGVGLVAAFAFAMIFRAVNASASSSAYNDAFNRWSGILSLVTVFAAVGFLILMRHRDIVTREFWLGGPHRDTYGEPNQLGTVSQYGERRMTPLACLAIIVVVLGVQGVVVLIQLAFSMFGIDLVSPTSESINESAVTVSMWLYIGLIGPICEEVMFRGVLMKELKPLGKNFAIFTSALAFGLFHDDLVQGVFAFLLGLILGFVAMEYSLVWAIALHIFNNAVLSGFVDTFLAGFLSDSGYMVYTVVLALAGVIGSIIIFVLYGRGLTQYRRANRSKPDTYYGWTSWAFIAFVAVNAIYALVSFFSAMLG